MTVIDWLLSVGATAMLLGIAVFLARNLILTRLKASVEHEFNAELETLRVELRKSEESFKADLRTKETQIEVLRSGALSGLTSRQAVLDKRRLEAVEQLWGGIEKLGPFKTAGYFINTLDFEKALEMAAASPPLRELFTLIGKTCDPEKLLALDVHKSRPFVSEIAWALFSAYQAIVLYGVVQVQMLKAGVRDAKLLHSDHVTKLVKLALPRHIDYIEKYGTRGYFNLLDLLESDLLNELRRMTRGEESDTASIEQAAKIMKEVASVNEAISKGSTTAT